MSKPGDASSLGCLHAEWLLLAQHARGLSDFDCRHHINNDPSWYQQSDLESSMIDYHAEWARAGRKDERRKHLFVIVAWLEALVQVLIDFSNAIRNLDTIKYQLISHLKQHFHKSCMHITRAKFISDHSSKVLFSVLQYLFAIPAHWTTITVDIIATEYHASQTTSGLHHEVLLDRRNPVFAVATVWPWVCHFIEV